MGGGGSDRPTVADADADADIVEDERVAVAAECRFFPNFFFGGGHGACACLRALMAGLEISQSISQSRSQSVREFQSVSQSISQSMSE